MIRSTLLVLTFAAGSAMAGSLVASYDFQNSLNAGQGGVPALTLIGSNSAYATDTVFGNTRTVLELNGTQGSGNNVGVSFDNTNGVSTWLPPTTYSVDLIFEFDNAGNVGGWRKILDVSNRTSDSGFYVDPSTKLDIFPVASAQNFSVGSYHQVILTVSGSTADVYYDSNSAVTVSTSVMNIGSGDPLDFLVDDAATGFNEYSPSKVAYLGLYDYALTQSDVTALYNNGNLQEFVPEPASLLLLAGPLLLLVAYKKRVRA